MTAEIAILNKSAVALAADSAVTISAGSDQHKVFDSADKLFELTQGDPIAVMINNDMSFMEAPLPVLIKEYRSTAPRFTHVRDAGLHFLGYLNDFAAKSPERIKIQSLEMALRPLVEGINNNARKKLVDAVIDDKTGELKPEFIENPDSVAALGGACLDAEIDRLQSILDILSDANFIGDGDLNFTQSEQDLFNNLSSDVLTTATEEQRLKVCDILQKAALTGC